MLNSAYAKFFLPDAKKSKSAYPLYLIVKHDSFSEHPTSSNCWI